MLSWLNYDSKRYGQIWPFYWSSKIVLNESTTSPDLESTGKEDVNALKIIQDLRKKMLSLKSEFLVVDGNTMTVNYGALGQSSLFQELVKLTHELPFINPLTMKDSERKSFYLNIYNILSLHGFTLRADRDSMSMMSKLSFYAVISYRIGPFILSLNDIEHGILRGNRPGPTPWISCQFLAEDDPRRQLTLSCDPRIHFALNCGSKSCPPIAIFASEESKLSHQLDICTSSFLENDVILDLEQNTITISSIFKFYRLDFGSSDAEIIQWIQKHAGSNLQAKLAEFITKNKGSFTINFLEWNWSSNSH